MCWYLYGLFLCVMWFQFARMKALEMERSVQLTDDASLDEEPAAKKTKDNVPDVRLFFETVSTTVKLYCTLCLKKHPTFKLSLTLSNLNQFLFIANFVRFPAVQKF